MQSKKGFTKACLAIGDLWYIANIYNSSKRYKKYIRIV